MSNNNIAGSIAGNYSSSIAEIHYHTSDDLMQTQSNMHDNETSTLPLSHLNDKERLSSLQYRLHEQIKFFAATTKDINAYSQGRNKNVEVG